MGELWSLLNFLQPEMFDDDQIFSSFFDAKKMDVEKRETATAIVMQEQKSSILSQIHRIIGPFMLRRKKSEVDVTILPKKEVLVYCPFTARQRHQYETFIKRVKYDKWWVKQHTDENHGADTMRGYHLQYMMNLRNAVNHPYVANPPSDPTPSQDMIDCCGKMQVLFQLLHRLTSEGHKTLVFSQFTRILDIVGKSLKMKGYKYCQLDGRTKLDERQDMVEQFFTDDQTMLFLLSTRAGGLGINLTAADTCIIYDSDWNPQQDLQAQDRCHRIGQTKPVVVYRLVTANTIDQKILERASAKRKLEQMVIHKNKFKGQRAELNQGKSCIDLDELMDLLKARGTEKEVKASRGKVISDKDLEILLDRSDLLDKEKGSLKKEKVGVFRVIDAKESSEIMLT